MEDREDRERPADVADVRPLYDCKLLCFAGISTMEDREDRERPADLADVRPLYDDILGDLDEDLLDDDGMDDMFSADLTDRDYTREGHKCYILTRSNVTEAQFKIYVMMPIIIIYNRKI